jgi:hypothetical protein
MPVPIEVAVFGIVTTTIRFGLIDTPYLLIYALIEIIIIIMRLSCGRG